MKPIKHALWALLLLGYAANAQYTFQFTDPVSQMCQWTVDKSVDPSSADLFVGDTQEVEWTVDVEFDGVDFSVDGNLTVSSGTTPANNKKLYICLQKDEITQGTCLNPTWVNLGLGNSYTNIYPYAFAGPYSKEAGAWRIFVEVRASNDVTVEKTETHALGGYFETCESEVTDTRVASEGPWNATEAGPNTWSYDEDFTCEEAGLDNEFDNTATVDEDSDSATFTLNCYALEVSKTVDATLDRTWTWGIEKVGEVNGNPYTGGLFNSEIQFQEVNYTVTLAGESDDDNWAISGTITVTNPHPTRAATLSGVLDAIGSVEAVVVCGSLSVPADGGELECTYSFNALDLVAGSKEGEDNVATAWLETYTFDKDEIGTLKLEADYSSFEGNEEVTYEPNHIDGCVELTDDKKGGDAVEVCHDDLVEGEHAWQYDMTVGPFDCDDAEEIVDGIATFEFDNTATFTLPDCVEPGNDIEPVCSGSDTWEITVTLECFYDCVLGYGFWRNHAENGNAAQYDPARAIWLAVGPEDGTFYLSGATWYEVYTTTSTGGNAYYILAKQYIAALLNQEAGASVPDAVQLDLDRAEWFFDNYTPDQVLGFKSKALKALRDEMIAIAKRLEAYNQGSDYDSECEEDCYPQYCTQPSDLLGPAKTAPAEEAFFSPVDEQDAVEVENTPTEYTLNRNYPNPFNPSTMISFQLPEVAAVRLSVFDVQGREVARLVDGTLSAGAHQVQFNASNLPSGTYFYTLTAGGKQFRQSMLLLK